MRYLIVPLCLFLCLQPVQAQVLFSQDFDTSTNISTYVNANPTQAQFTYAAAGNANSSIAISGKKIRLVRTDCASPGQVALVRTKNFATVAPTMLKVGFKLNAMSSTSAFIPSNPAPVVLALFNIGSSFTNDLSSNTGTTHTRLAVYVDSSITGKFQLRDGNSAGTTTASSPFFVGEKQFTMYINNSGSTQTYTGPNGTSYTLGNDKWDMWEGGQNRFFSNMPAASTSSSISLQNFKWYFYQNTGTISVDDLIFTAL